MRQLRSRPRSIGSSLVRQRPACEALEPRTLLSGSWNFLIHGVPGFDGAQAAMLLSDGSVMVHGGWGNQSSAFYKLTPDASGNYIDGSWTTLASMSVARLYYGSVVLPNGNVVVVGGEYSSVGGDTNTGEIYDPLFNSWSNIDPNQAPNVSNFPQASFGDDPLEVLPDGRVLAGYINGPQSYIYDPSTQTWGNAISKVQNDRSDEESWVKLPDNSILTYDIFSSIANNQGEAERYVPSQQQWVQTGPVPVQLSNNAIGQELGAALLLPDGDAFFLGGNGHTAYYHPATDSWTQGPDIPHGLGCDDAPAVLMPNGKVLFAADTPKWNQPSSILEYDPVQKTYTDVYLNAFTCPAYQLTMLLLPTGQVLLCDDNNDPEVFTPDPADGTPAPAWQPRIASITDNGGGAYTLTGTQLNGLSEGAAYGDDAQMAENYPIVCLTDAQGHVSYARTSYWSSTGVATGSTPETVEFTRPAQDPPGVYSLSVIADGIASKPVLAVFGGSNDQVVLDRQNGNTLATFDNATTSTSSVSIDGVDVLLGMGASTVDVRGTAAGDHTWISGTSWAGDTITFNGGGSQNLQGVTGDVHVVDPGCTINIDDTKGSGPQNTSLFTDSTGLWGTISGLALGNIDYEYFSTSRLNLITGPSGVVAIASTGEPTSITAANPTKFQVGSQGQVQGLFSALSLESSGGPSTLTVDDSADRGVRPLTVDTFTPANDTPWDRITGLAPSAITYEDLDFKNVTILAGQGGDTINVWATGVPTAIIGNGGLNADGGPGGPGGVDPVVVGYLGSVQNIKGWLSLENPAGKDKITIDDSLDPNAQNSSNLKSFVPTAGETWGALMAFAPAGISYEYTDTQSLTIKTGHGGGTLRVLATGDAASGVPTFILGNGGQSMTGGPGAVETVIAGQSGSVQNVTGALSVESPAGHFALTVDDSTDPTGRSATLDSFTPSGDSPWGSITGLAPAEISYEAADTNAPVTVKGGTGGNTFHVNSLPTASSKLALLAGSGNDTVYVPATPGSLSVDGQGGTNSVVGPHVFNATWTLTGSGTGTVGGTTFSNIQRLTSGLLGDTFVFQPGSGVTGTVDGGASGRLNYAAYGAAITVDLRSNSATATGGFAHIATVIGSSSPSNLLHAADNQTNLWQLSGQNAGTLFSATTLGFTAFPNLTGGNGVDVFLFSPGTSVSGQLSGGGGGDWLDYGAYNAPVQVNLANQTATGVGGKIFDIQDVRGGNSGNVLTGNALGNIMVGGSSADQITAGSGRSVLIGDKGNDTITGGIADDIVIGGTTGYDPGSLANDLALEAILAEWQSADVYQTRVNDVTKGGGLNGTNTLVWGTNVLDDLAGNVLTGGPGQAWFFAGVNDQITDRRSGEQVNN
jgi:hypothetical protein